MMSAQSVPFAATRRGFDGRLVCTLAALAAVAGTTQGVRADDDDPMLAQKEPARIARIYHGPDRPDAWKTIDHHAIGGNADDTFQSRNVLLKTWVPLNMFPGFANASSPSGADCWGYVAPSGREYALMGLSWGDGIVEVTDPSNPVIRPTIPGGVNSLWRDITVIGHYAYAVSDSSGVGIQVIDLANIDTGGATLIRNYSQGGHTTTHTILSNPDSGYLYLCGGNAISRGGLVPANTNADPTFPAFTGPGWTTQYVHEAQIVNYTSGPYAGHEIAFEFAAGPYYGSSYTHCLAIVDVTDKAAPQQLSFVSYPGMRFCHQGWISADRKYLYVDDELDGPGAGNGNVPSFLCRVFDISDLTNPRMVSTFNNGNTAIDHNQYTTGRYLFQSNYSSGCHVWDLSNPLKPVEIAWIDTRPEDDGAQYHGAWGNYPFFPSGTFIVSDLERGLFICRLSILELSPVSPASMPTILPPELTQPVAINVVGKDANIASVSVMVSVNGGAYTAYPMSLQGANRYSGTLPALSCTDRVNYYFRAQTDDPTPRTFTWPVGAQSATPDVIQASVEDSRTTVFADNFDTDLGWTVQGTAGSGAWVRGTPLSNGGPGAVVGDADGSNHCFVTGNTANEEVNGGPTRLLSPVFDLSATPEARVTVSRWVLSIQGTTDNLVTEVSNNNGSTWTQVEALGPASGAWSRLTFRIADYVPPTNQVRVRFSIADSTNDSVTEAGVDAFSIWTPNCPAAACYANCDGSTSAPILNVNDFVCFQTRFAAGDSYANCDGSTTPPVLNVNDFVCYQSQFAAGCP